MARRVLSPPVPSGHVPGPRRGPVGQSIGLPLGGGLALAVVAALVAGRWESPRIGFVGKDPVDFSSGGFWRQSVASVVVAAMVSLALGLIARAVGHRAGIVVMPRLWRVAPRPTPLLGSFAIIAGIVIGVLVGAPQALGSRKLMGAAIGVVAMAALGLTDDLRGLTPRTRVLWTIFAAQLAWMMGLRAAAFPGGAAGDVANALLTMLWFVGITHAFNVIDNMDGASAGVAMASSLSIAALAAATNQGVLVVVALGIAASCVGYLVHNVFPARLYMGDSGALALGFAVAALGLMLVPPVGRPIGFALPVLAATIPIFDTALVTVSRIRKKKRVALGGTDHLTHRLLVAGLHVRAIPLFLFGAQLLLGGAAFVIGSVAATTGWAVLVLIGCLGTAALVLLLRVPEWKPQPAIQVR